MKKEIASFCHNLEVNGSNRFLFLLIRQLRKMGSNIALFSPEDGPLRADYEAIGVTVSITPINHPSYKDTLSQIVTSYQMAIVNTIIRAEAVCAASAANLPHLWIIHESWPLEDFERMAKSVWKWSWPDKSTIFNAFELAQLVVYPASITKSIYANIATSGQHIVIPNGVDLNEIILKSQSLDRKSLRSQLFAANEDDIIVLIVGSINERKNQLGAVKALGSIKNRANLKLILVGSRQIRAHEIEYTKLVENEAARLGVSHQVQIHPVTRDIGKYYLSADIAFCPSISEVLPYAIMEAMAYGLPIIASDVDGIPEMVDSTTGILSSPTDYTRFGQAISSLASDTNRRQAMGLKARETVFLKYNVETMLTKYQSIIGELISR